METIDSNKGMRILRNSQNLGRPRISRSKNKNQITVTEKAENLKSIQASITNYMHPTTVTHLTL